MELHIPGASNIEPELQEHDHVPRLEEILPNDQPIEVRDVSYFVLLLEKSLRTSAYQISILSNGDYEQNGNERITNFTAFPPEIRNIIYRLLLERDGVIPIRSPLKRKTSNLHRYYYQLLSKKDSAIGILRVSKQVHEEACSVFYSVNEFCVGNHDWGVTLQQNIHGLKAFTSRVPAHFIARIRHVQLRISTHYRSSGYQPIYPVLLGSTLDVTEVEQLIRALKKYFTGMEEVYFSWDHVMSGTGQPKMPRDETVVEFTKLVQSVMKLPLVKCVILSNISLFNGMSHEITGLREVVARIQEEALQSSKDLTVETMPSLPQIILRW